MALRGANRQGAAWAQDAAHAPIGERADRVGSRPLERAKGPSYQMRAKKVVLIGNQVETLMRFRGPLIRAMVARGNDVYALVPDYTERGRKEVRKLGATPIEIRLHRTSLSLTGCLHEAWRLQRILREIQPDVVLTYFLKPIIVGSLAARLANVPSRFSLIEGAGYVYAEHDAKTFGRRLLRSLVTRLLRMALVGSERVFVLNPDDESLMINLGISAEDRITRLPGIGIDLEFFRPAPQVRAPITFLLAARLIPEKGIRDYVAAARRVRGHHPDTRFLLLGSADEHPSRIADAEVRQWVEEGLIEWPGHVEDVRPYMAAASVYVLPSFYREGLPRSLLEAMAMARPLITTDAPGCREAVVDGENGFLVPVRDPDALAAAMMHFVRQPNLITSMGQASARIALRTFDVRAVNMKLMRAMALEEGMLVGLRPRPRDLLQAARSAAPRARMVPLPVRK